MKTPPVCNYEGSDYQTSFWDQGGRDYEDRAEAVALKRMLPASGQLMLELGAGAGRNTARYAGFAHVVLLDYSSTQLQQAQQRLGQAEQYTFVAADIYRLPFVEDLFDGATMIRTLHHMADAPVALRQVQKVLQPNATFILEYANKRNIKSILRWWLGKQSWNPFSLEPVEFVKLNFDFHPKAIRAWLHELGFQVEKTLTVSHFRLSILKRLIPTGVLVWLDSLAQLTGALWQLTPSVFVKTELSKAGKASKTPTITATALFKCPDCGHHPLAEQPECLACQACGKKWAIRDGIYDFRTPVP